MCFISTHRQKKHTLFLFSPFLYRSPKHENKTFRDSPTGPSGADPSDYVSKKENRINITWKDNLLTRQSKIWPVPSSLSREFRTLRVSSQWWSISIVLIRLILIHCLLHAITFATSFRGVSHLISYVEETDIPCNFWSWATSLQDTPGLDK